MITKLYVKSAIALHEFKKDQRGVTAIEYAIIGVAISSIVLAVFNGSLRAALTEAMSTISSNISTAANGPTPTPSN
ncbi:Flp family type IVb pilin [Moritella sp. 5]|uniref:Flp family type IVb pilin n=1 Tax=Moritella sp. 5 TaxID=2746231 RepID=UPI001BA78EB0|nr:Flp family type IVb pilin [Moritella sp. 5]QUM81955.1 Flp family type IVb pilin [Moritella sp. 5]